MRKRKKRLSLEPLIRMPYNSIFLLLFLGGFLAGILFANLGWNLRAEAADGLWALDLYDISKNEISAAQSFFYLFRVRMKMPLLLWLLGMTDLGIAAASLFLLWSGFLGGLLACAVLLVFGAGNMVQLFLYLFLPMLIYVPATIWMLHCIFDMQQMRAGQEHQNRRIAGRYGLYFALWFAVNMTGIWVEACVNPTFLHLFEKF